MLEFKKDVGQLELELAGKFLRGRWHARSSQVLWSNVWAAVKGPFTHSPRDAVWYGSQTALSEDGGPCARYLAF